MLARGLLLLTLYAEVGVCVQAQGSICSSGIFPALKQTLGSQPEVLAYCQAHYPVAPATVFKRNAKSKCPPKPNPSTITPRQQPASTTTSRPGNKLDELLALAPHLIKTACSCIQGQVTVTVRTSTALPSTTSSTSVSSTESSSPSTTAAPSTTTEMTTSSTSTSAAAPAHTVDAPRCNSSVYTNGGCNDACVCQSDVDGTEYCSSQFSFEDSSIQCTSSADCPQGDFCESLDQGLARCATGTQPGNECSFSERTDVLT